MDLNTILSKEIESIVIENKKLEKEIQALKNDLRMGYTRLKQ